MHVHVASFITYTLYVRIYMCNILATYYIDDNKSQWLAWKCFIASCMTASIYADCYVNDAVTHIYLHEAFKWGLNSLRELSGHV